MSYTSKFGPREVTVGSVATNAASQSFTALCTSFKWPHLGCLISPARYVELNRHRSKTFLPYYKTKNLWAII